MYEILMIVYLVVALALIGFILVQHGKGAGMGASFGSGASGTVFGASGSGNFLTKTTTILAIVFFGVALGLGNLTSNTTAPTEESLFSEDTIQQAPATESDDVPTGDLPISNSTGDLPVEDSTGDLPVDDSTGDLPTENKIPVEETTAEEPTTEEPDAIPEDGDGNN